MSITKYINKEDIVNKFILSIIFICMLFCPTVSSQEECSVDDPCIIEEVPTVKLVWFNEAADCWAIISGEIVICAGENEQETPLMSVIVDDAEQFLYGTQGEYCIWDMVQELPDGLYWFYIRVQSFSEKQSDWSEAAVGIKEWEDECDELESPPKPSGCRIF